mmetsp:Transcript_9346/g.12083  ORF Transcript_9346/g.12083 Transcript_9346/m.12083 type:complete len:402 (-) Transcript_9346:316-1521(-)
MLLLILIIILLILIITLISSSILLQSLSFSTSSTNSMSSEWLDVASILENPLQMPMHRMKVVSQAFGKVAGIPIRLQGDCGSGKRGIVLFYAPHGSLLSKSSKSGSGSMRIDSFMKASAVLISSAIAWSLERDAVSSCSRRRREVELSVCHRTSLRNGDGSMMKEGLGDVGAGVSFLDAYFVLGCVTISMRQWWNKMKGGSTRPSGRLSSSTSLFSFFGSLTLLLILSLANEFVIGMSNHDNRNKILLGPLGAFVTLQFNLTTAPACQPYNAIISQFLAVILALAFSQIQEELLPVWLRTSIVPSLTIGLSAMFGFTHPPAGASALAFAQERNLKVTDCCYFLFANLITIFGAAGIINMDDSKQYPIYWGFDGLFDRLPSCSKEKNKLEDTGHLSTIDEEI